MATAPVYAATAVIGIVQVSTANTNRDGTGTLGTVIAGASGGRRIRRLLFKATGTTTAGMLRIFVYDGSNTRCIGEVAVLAVTPSGSLASWAGSFALPPEFTLPSSSYEIRVGTQNAETFNCFALGDDV